MGVLMEAMFHQNNNFERSILDELCQIKEKPKSHARDAKEVGLGWVFLSPTLFC